MNHAPSVVIISWQRSERGNVLFMYETCSIRCLRLMKTDKTWLYIPKVWNMLCQLSSSRDNDENMVRYPFGINHAPSVVVISWQLSEHGYISFIYENFHRLVTTMRTWLDIPLVSIMLRQLSSSHGNGQSMVTYPSCINHAPSVVIVSWQRSEHGYSCMRYETCSVSCHSLLTTVRAW